MARVRKKNVFNGTGQRGSGLVAALFCLLVMGGFGTLLVQISAVEGTAAVDRSSAVQALYVGNSGIEAALYRLDYGFNPVVNNQPFGAGSYTITTDPALNRVTAVGVVASTKKTQSIDADFSNICVQLDPSAAYASGPNLRDVKLVKTCNAQAIVSKMTIDWNWPSCGFGQGGDDYSQYQDPNHPGHILVCHVPPGNPGNKKTRSMTPEEWEEEHQNHPLDNLGCCEGDAECPLGGGDPDPVACDDAIHGDHGHGNSKISHVSLVGTTIYDAATGVGTPTPLNANPTEEINLVDYILTNNAAYSFISPNGEGITFSTNIPAGGWFTITVEFDDGSKIYTIFTL